MNFDIEEAIAGVEGKIRDHEMMINRLYAELLGVGPATIPILFFLGQQLKRWGVSGSVCEVGLMQGVYLIILSLLAEQGEKVIGIDVFEDQKFNLDHSGIAQEQAVLDNLRRFVPYPDMIELIKADSTSLRSFHKMAEIADQTGEVKVFSVDGCHTKQHTMSDIDLGANLLVNGGLLIIDDFTNDGWPGVAEATSTYFATRNVRLAPLVACFNKLICTTISHQSFYYDAISQWIGTPSFERHYGHAKATKVYETPIWHLNQFRAV